MVLMKMKARGDKDGDHRAPAPGVEEAAPRREAPGGGAAPAALGAEAPCPFFFLGDGAGVDEFLPLLGCCHEGGILWLWLGASKNRVSHQYIELDMQSRPWDGCLFDPRALEHL